MREVINIHVGQAGL